MSVNIKKIIYKCINGINGGAIRTNKDKENIKNSKSNNIGCFISTGIIMKKRAL